MPFETNYGFTLRTNWSAAVSENQGIHPNSELLVKDWEGIWQEVRQNLQKPQERERKQHDQKRQPATDYMTLEDVLRGGAKKGDRVMLKQKKYSHKAANGETR